MQHVIVITPSLHSAGRLAWGYLTTDHPESTDNLPVLLINGQAHGPADLPASSTVIALDATAALTLRAWAAQGAVTADTPGLLTATEASRYYEALTGQPLSKQRFSQWARRGDVASALVVRIETRVPTAEIDRLIRDGLPNRGKGGRPRLSPSGPRPFDGNDGM